ncbi:MAG: hypothetical protein GC131_02810 [Alphaproteobacteria bacterium]|nr:hypothetical protein [Alphaproteobacteria bacterium]
MRSGGSALGSGLAVGAMYACAAALSCAGKGFPPEVLLTVGAAAFCVGFLFGMFCRGRAAIIMVPVTLAVGALICTSIATYTP